MIGKCSPKDYQCHMKCKCEDLCPSCKPELVLKGFKRITHIHTYSRSPSRNFSETRYKHLRAITESCRGLEIQYSGYWIKTTSCSVSSTSFDLRLPLKKEHTWLHMAFNLELQLCYKPTIQGRSSGNMDILWALFRVLSLPALMEILKALRSSCAYIQSRMNLTDSTLLH